MVKHILLISLFLFMPFVSRADGIVIGNNIDEKNIPLEMDIMDETFVLGFENVRAYEMLKEKFYGYFYDNLDVPFSLRDLVNACRKSTKIDTDFDYSDHTNNCIDFARSYVKRLAEYAGDDVTKTNQKMSVSGEKYSVRVIDADTQEPLVGANVLNLNYPDRGCVTDINGSTGGCTDRELMGGRVRVSYIGYKTQEVSLTVHHDNIIMLEENIIPVEIEHIVIGNRI